MSSVPVGINEELPDILRARLRNGLHIADIDVIRLLDLVAARDAEIARLRDEVRHLRSAFTVLHDDGNTTPSQRAWILRVLDGSSWIPFKEAGQ